MCSRGFDVLLFAADMMNHTKPLKRMRYWDRQKPCRQLSFDFFVRHRFSTFDLVKPFADSSQKFDTFRDDIETRGVRQALNRIQSQLLVAHKMNLSQTRRKCNGGKC